MQRSFFFNFFFRYLHFPQDKQHEYVKKKKQNFTTISFSIWSQNFVGQLPRPCVTSKNNLSGNLETTSAKT